MATILISHCERNLGRVEKHVGTVGRGGSGECPQVSPSTVSLLSQDGGHLAVIFSWFNFIFFYTACRLLSARVRKAKLLIRRGYI